jgi:hypothetical protein
MTSSPNVRNVGAMDPQLRNSPIAQEFDEDSDTMLQQVPGEPVCYFNGREFRNDAYVRSGAQLLKCRYGVWIDAGPGDPDNP